MPKNPADMYVIEFSLREEREARQTGLKFPRKEQAVAAAKRLAKQTGEQVFVNIKDEWKAPFSGRPMVSYWSAYKVADGTVYKYGPSGYYTATDYR